MNVADQMARLQVVRREAMRSKESQDRSETEALIVKARERINRSRELLAALRLASGSDKKR